METRVQTIEVEQVKIYRLIMNDMRYPKIEMRDTVAISCSLEAIQKWEQDQRASEMWRDGRYNKTYKGGTALEWKNPVIMEPDHFKYSAFKQGLKEEWINLDYLNNFMNNPDYIFVPEDY